MKNLTKKIVLVTITIGLLANSYGVAVASQNIKSSSTVSMRVTPQLTYQKTMAKAKADFIATVTSSRKAAVTIGRPADAIRRAKVSAALKSYNLVASKAKGSSLLAEASYKKAIKSLLANPTNASLKANVKNAIALLTKETLALKSNTSILAARTEFNKARATAMSKFKATIASAIKTRNHIQGQALAKYKLAKAKADAKLKLALKSKTPTPKTTPTK